MKEVNETNENYCHIEQEMEYNLQRAKVRQADKEDIYKECIEMLQDNDPNGEYWAIIHEHGNDYCKAMQVLQECVAMSLQMAIQDKDKDEAKFYIKVLREATKY
jgi:mannose-6-phosphate isomerase class I